MYRWRGNSRREPWRYEDEEAQRMGREMMEMWKELSKWRWRDVGVEVWRWDSGAGTRVTKASGAGRDPEGPAHRPRMGFGSDKCTHPRKGQRSLACINKKDMLTETTKI